MKPKKRIVKLGGSLLSREGVIGLFSSWLHHNADMQNIIVVGGGELADAIRRMQNSLSLDDSSCHRLACRTMSLNAAAVVKSGLSCVLVDRFETLSREHASVVVFDSVHWISKSDNIPANWDFTSDSIAAKLATDIRADELVLIKSRSGSLTEPDIVDPCFAKYSRSIPNIRICTLNS